jgi:hypothetical protein
MGPIFRRIAKPLPNRIHQNVIPFLRRRVVIAQPMIEEIGLPRDSELPRCVSLPIAYRPLKPRLDWKMNNGVEMIRHKQK